MATYYSVSATGASGVVYEFQVYPRGTEFRRIPGLYIFCRPDAQGGWNASYVGHTNDLQERVGSGLARHHCYQRAIGAKVSHIAVCPFPGREADRVAAESDLIAALSPPLNRTNPYRGILSGFG